jgi:hypothetical protein
MTSPRKPLDMSINAQCKRVLELLRSGPQTTYSLRAHGISHPAQRIIDLEDQGFCFDSGRVSAVDSDGYLHRGVAIYALAERQPDLVDQMEAA